MNIKQISKRICELIMFFSVIILFISGAMIHKGSMYGMYLHGIFALIFLIALTVHIFQNLKRIIVIKRKGCKGNVS